MLVRIDGETLSAPVVDKKPKARKSNPLGGMTFRDYDAETPCDEQQLFRDKLLALYPEAANPIIDESLSALVVDMDELRHDDKNAVTHPEPNMRAIMTSFAEFGQRKPIVVRRENMTVMAGNGSLEAARRLGWTRIAAVVQSMSDAVAYAYALADNRTSDMHKWDNAKVLLLDQLIKEANDPKIKTVGWTIAELTAIRKKMETPPTRATLPDGMVLYKIVIDCDSESQQVELLKEMQERQLKCKAIIA